MRHPLPWPPRALALLLATQLVACLDKADDNDDADGGSDETSDSGWTDGGTGGGGACPDLLPLDDIGAVKVYEYVDGATVSGGYTVTWTGPETREGETVYGARTEMAYSGDGFEAEYDTRSWYRCDGDGAWLLAQDSEGVTVTSAGETPTSSTTTYTTPPLVMIPDAGVGDTWTYSYEAVTVDHTGYKSTYGEEYGLAVVERADVTVPAGTYDALLVDYEGGGGGYATWYAAGVGAVANDYVELVDER